MKLLNTSREHLTAWVGQAAALGSDKTFRVLDAGAGIAPYRGLFDHVTYETQDFAQVDKAYTALDYVCEITDLPMPDGTYDLVICNQVLEHLPEPIVALTELARVTKPGGQLWLSAPLFFAEHEQPYDFHRYTRFAWQRMAEQVGLDLRECEWLEGYYGTLSYQLGMAASELPRKHLLSRVLFKAQAWRFARLDMVEKRTDIGMCKNYRCVMVKAA